MTAFANLNLGSAPNDGTGTTLRAGGSILNANFALAANLEEDNTYTANNIFERFVTFGASASFTISSGVIAISRSNIKVTGEGNTSDDLDTINITAGIPDGTIIIIRKDGSGTITVTENGNIYLEGTSIALSLSRDKLTLIYDETNARWTQMAFADNG